MRQATKLGSSNRSYYVQATQQMYTDPLGSHPSSNAYLGSKCTHSSKHLTLKASMGVLFTQARAALLGLSATTACPLCGSQDSIGHMLGHCAYSAMRPLYISRHDQAVIHLHWALEKGADGGHTLCITVVLMVARELHLTKAEITKLLHNCWSNQRRTSECMRLLLRANTEEALTDYMASTSTSSMRPVDIGRDCQGLPTGPFLPQGHGVIPSPNMYARSMLGTRAFATPAQMRAALHDFTGVS